MSGSPSKERIVGLIPYEEGAVLPPTAQHAVEDAIRYLGTQHPWDEVREQVRGMDPSRVFWAATGGHVTPDLNLVEKYLTHTLDYCGRTGLTRGTVDAIMTVASVQFEVLNDRFFVGQELPSKPHINQAPE